MLIKISRIFRITIPALILLFSYSALQAQTFRVIDSTKYPKHEFRGAWIATVSNLDWPDAPGASPGLQKGELEQMFNRLEGNGVTSVFFQVRTECDALYDSPYEPWSYYLTSSEGTAPSPFWDPLEYAIELAHERGMELHAWFNPYRALRTIPDNSKIRKEIEQDGDEQIPESVEPFANRYDGGDQVQSFPRADNHVSNTHPEWLINVDNEIAILDPGLPEVREYNVKVIMDVVNRYNIDGVHFDDYFYPYPPNQISMEDEDTYKNHKRGFDDIGDWRRDNINIFIEMLHDSLEQVKPYVKFGISPFGIYKNGEPVPGMDAHNTIYADPLAWVEEQTIDYLAPQLYWRFGGNQDYGKLAPWWNDHIADRHLYTGHILKSSYFNFEVPRQIRFNRDYPNIHGSIIFRASLITESNTNKIKDSLKANVYPAGALPPTMSFKSQAQPGQPSGLTYSWDEDQPDNNSRITLKWNAPQYSEPDSMLMRYAVYRFDATEAPHDSSYKDARHLIDIVGDTTFTDNPPESQHRYFYAVTALSSNFVESEASTAVDVGTVVSVDEREPLVRSYELDQNYPNPFNPTTNIGFTLPEQAEVSLAVYDMTGRKVAELVDGFYQAGKHNVTFDAQNLASGVYVYRLDAGEVSVSRKMILLK